MEVQAAVLRVCQGESSTEMQKLHLTPVRQRDYDTSCPPSFWWLSQGCSEPDADLFGGSAKRIIVKVRITLRGSWPRMTQELANDWQAQTRARAEARMGMAQIVNSNSDKTGPLSDRAPRLIEVGAWFFLFGASILSGDHIGADVRQASEHGHGRCVEHDRFFPGLAIGQRQQPAL
jgi:hypothetical protein